MNDESTSLPGDAAGSGRRAERIARILEAALAPTVIDVRDESASHAHHAGMRGHPAGGETHFDVLIRSARFEGLTRLQRHRLVHDLLKDEFGRGLHALSLDLDTGCSG